MAERGWTLEHPHPDHQPRVLAYLIGRGRKGTALGCSCGLPLAMVSTRPPSRGGRTDAGVHYQAHLDRLLDPDPARNIARPIDTEGPPCLW